MFKVVYSINGTHCDESDVFENVFHDGIHSPGNDWHAHDGSYNRENSCHVDDRSGTRDSSLAQNDQMTFATSLPSSLYDSV